MTDITDIKQEIIIYVQQGFINMAHKYLKIDGQKSGKVYTRVALNNGWDLATMGQYMDFKINDVKYNNSNK
jgi:hypothetical protein